MKKPLLILTCLLCSWGIFGQISGTTQTTSAPSNDDCNGAIQLISQTTCSNTSGTVDNATADNFPNRATCDLAATSLGAGVFYKFTAAATTETITVTPTGTLDAIVVLYSGVCNNLAQVGCIDQPGGNGVVTVLTVSSLTVGQQYTIRVYDYGSANATSGGFNICVTHQCTPPPAPSGITGGGNSVCQSSTATLDLGALGQNPSSSGGQWVWYSGSCGGTSVGTGMDYYVSEAQPGTTTYYLRAENSCGNSSCVSTTVTIVAKPTAPAPTATPSPVCQGSNFTLNANVNGTDYQWYNPSNSLISQQQNPTISTGVGGSYCLSYRQNGCWSDNGCVSVTINPLPSVGITPSNPSIISGASATLNANGATSYSWSNGSGGSSIIVSPTQTTTYTVTGTSNGCTATAQVTVNVSPPCSNPPTASAGSGGSYTSGMSIGGSPTASGGTGPYTYSWSPPTALSSTTVANPTVSGLTATQVYTVTVTDANHCTASAQVTVSGPTCSNPPTANAGANAAYTAGMTIGGNPTASGGTAPYTYAWSPGTGLSSNSIANPVVSGVTGTQTYSVIVTDANGCTATSSVTVGQACSNPLSNPVLQINGCSLSIAPMANVVYQWYFNNQPIAQANGIQLLAQSGNGSYFVIVTSLLDHNCTAQTTPVNLVCTGIEELNLSDLSISPNPSSDNFMIGFESPEVIDIKIKVYNMLGQVVKEITSQKVAGHFSKELNMNSDPKGTYILEISSGSRSLHRRISLQ